MEPSSPFLCCPDNCQKLTCTVKHQCLQCKNWMNRDQYGYSIMRFINCKRCKNNQPLSILAHPTLPDTILVPLHRIGGYALASACDRQLLSSYKWTETRRGVASYSRYNEIVMRNLIIGYGKRVSFRDGDRRNHRRDNLNNNCLTQPSPIITKAIDAPKDVTDLFNLPAIIDSDDEA